MQRINEYMKKNNLLLKDEEIDPHIKCHICNLVMDKPKISVCGCHFCTICIEPYLTQAIVECPNCTTILNVQDDLGHDLQSEFKIRKLKMSCPNLNCDIKLCINEMCEHLSVCGNMDATTCVLNPLGCNAVFAAHADLKNHLYDDLENHFGLIINHLESVNNEKSEKMSQLEEEIDEMKNAHSTLVNKIDHKRKTKRISNLEKELEDFKMLEIKKKSQQTSVTDIMKMMNKLEMDNLKLKKEFEDEKTKNTNNSKENEHLKTKLENEQKTCENLKLEMEKMKTDMAEMQSDLTYLMDSTNKQYRIKIGGISRRCFGLKPNYSDTFRVNNYKFVIQFDFWNRDVIEFFVKLVEGDSDANVKWPLKNTMKLKVLKKNGAVAATRSFSWATSKNKSTYNKPTKNEHLIKESRIEIDSTDILENDSFNLIFIMKSLN